MSNNNEVRMCAVPDRVLFHAWFLNFRDGCLSDIDMTELIKMNISNLSKQTCKDIIGILTIESPAGPEAELCGLLQKKVGKKG